MNKSIPKEVDVIVVGGGPSGSTTSSFLLKEGLSVAIIERSSFPRYHIGESLVPQVLDVLDESGSLPAVESAGFLRKEGGVFRWGKKSEPWSFYFDEETSRYRHTYAYQVIRSEFDQILLNHAKNLGARIIKGEVLKENFPRENSLDSRVNLTVKSNDQDELELKGKIVVDCSGLSGWLANKYHLRKFDPFLKNIAIFGYFEGADRLPGRDRNGILCEAITNGWLWNIPLHDNTNSVGFISRFKPSGLEDALRIYKEAIDNSSYVKPLLSNARTVERDGKSIRTIPDYSYSSTQLIGPGFVMVGDAGNFIDPIWSTGIFLSTTSAKMAANAVSKFIKEGNVNQLDEYEIRAQSLYKTYINFVHFFYNTNGNPEDYFWKAYQLVGKDSAVNPRDAFIRLVAGRAGLPMEGSK